MAWRALWGVQKLWEGGLPVLREAGCERVYEGWRVYVPLTFIIRPCKLTLDNAYSNTDAEYCTLRSEAAVRIPADADPASYAPLLCAGVTVFNGIRKMDIGPGDIVAVQGLGGLGHLALQYARRMGYRTVALSTNADKRGLAVQLGATDFIDTGKDDATEALQKMGGASLIVVTAPDAQIMGPLVKGLAPMGKVLILAGEFLFPTHSSLTLVLASHRSC